jgi:hypothetical protein
MAQTTCVWAPGDGDGAAADGAGAVDAATAADGGGTRIPSLIQKS